MPQHHPSRSVTLPAVTSDSRMVMSVVGQLLRGMPRDGIAYKKAGVALLDLTRPDALQDDLFAPPVVGNPALLSAVDEINAKFGRGSAGLGATGWETKPASGTRQRHLSPCYTTKLSDLPSAKC